MGPNDLQFHAPSGRGAFLAWRAHDDQRNVARMRCDPSPPCHQLSQINWDFLVGFIRMRIWRGAGRPPDTSDGSGKCPPLNVLFLPSPHLINTLNRACIHVLERSVSFEPVEISTRSSETVPGPNRDARESRFSTGFRPGLAHYRPCYRVPVCDCPGTLN